MPYMNCVANPNLGLNIIVFIHFLHQNYLYEHGNYYMSTVAIIFSYIGQCMEHLWYTMEFNDTGEGNQVSISHIQVLQQLLK